MGVQLPRHAPINLRVGKSGNPPDLESGDRWIEASHADHFYEDRLIGRTPSFEVGKYTFESCSSCHNIRE
jgi:hypothetical protein